MVTTFNFLIHISSIKVAFVFISLYEILRIQDPATVQAKGTYRRVLFDVFLFFFLSMYGGHISGRQKMGAINEKT